MSFKSTFLQDYLIVVLVLAIVASAVIAHCGIVWIAMLAGYIISMIATRLIFKSRWHNQDFRSMSDIRKYIISSIPALIGSQASWVALLI